MTNSSRNKLDALAATQERIGGAEVYSAEEVQEIVEITAASGAAKSVWPIQKHVVVRSKSKKEVKLAAASGSANRVEGGAKLEFILEGKKCYVKRPLASVSAIVEGGSKVAFGQHESYIENEGTGQRILMSRKKGVFSVQLNAVSRSKAKEKASVFKRLA